METENITMSLTDDLSDPPNGESEDKVTLCFVCCSIVKDNQDKTLKSDGLLTKNLNVIFLLKNLLQLPDTHLISYLKENGNPNDWLISLCESCRELTIKAMNLHWEFIKCQNELLSVQMLLIEKIKSSAVNKKENNLNQLQVNSTTWKKSREFIKKHDYMVTITKVNPFVDGDKLARHLVERNTESIPPENEQLNRGNSSPNINNEINADQDSEDDSNQDDEEFNPDDDEFNQDDDSEWEQKESSKKIERKGVPTKRLRDWSKYKKINGKIKCSYCEKVFSKRKYVRVHEDEFHCTGNPGGFICDICGHPWNTSTRLRQHKRDVHNLRPDGTSIKKEVDLKIGGKQKRTRKWKGQEEPSQKITKKLPMNPVRDWSKYENIGGKIKCNFCEKVFSQRKGVRVHENEFHSNSPGQFVCDICGSLWNTHARLRQHKRDAHKLRPDGSSITKDLEYTCHICGKLFSRPSKLNRHVEGCHKEKT